MTAPLEEIDDLNFEQEVLGSQRPYLLDFSATWCAPCKALQPLLETLASEQQGRLRIGKIDIDASPAIAARLGVRGAPTLVLFQGGREIARKLGFANKSALQQLVQAADSSPATSATSAAP